MNYKEIFDQRGQLYNDAHQFAPRARHMESDAMLRWLEPVGGETILVVAAGGGFDAVCLEQDVMPDAVSILCVEPSTMFSDFIPDRFTVYNSPLEEIPLQDESVDVVLNLAALHHIEARDCVFDEWARLLKPGGRIVIGDVAAGSDNAAFLNEAVNAYTPGGHDGSFIESGYLTKEFHMRGFIDCKEALESYQWTFESEDEMVTFSRLIFGMVNAQPLQVADAIRRYLNPQISVKTGEASYDWSLHFFKAYKS